MAAEKDKPLSLEEKLFEMERKLASKNAIIIALQVFNSVLLTIGIVIMSYQQNKNDAQDSAITQLGARTTAIESTLLPNFNHINDKFNNIESRLDKQQAIIEEHIYHIKRFVTK